VRDQCESRCMAFVDVTSVLHPVVEAASKIRSCFEFRMMFESSESFVVTSAAVIHFPLPSEIRSSF
jgi:hypothetical protein